MTFVLFNTRTNAYRQSNGVIREWHTKYDAERYRVGMLSFPDQWEVRELDNAPWRVAARNAYATEDKTPTVWHNQRWHLHQMETLGHYPWVDIAKDTNLINFYPTLEKGEKGQSQAIKPGKYLKTFYGDILSEDSIKEWVNKHKEEFANVPKLQWARTADEIEAVYSMEAGFQSCMQHSRSHWGHSMHPTRAYGAGDLAIAYLTKDDRLIARALVWPEKKRVGRVYGEGALLRNALRAAGIPTSSDNSVYDSMDGARMLYIPLPHRRRFDSIDNPALLPYVDSRNDVYGVAPLKDAPSVLALTHAKKGKYLAADQGGVIYPTRLCVCCGENYNANNAVVTKPGAKADRISEYTEYVCASCREDSTFKDAAYNIYFSKKAYTQVPYHHYPDEAFSRYTQYLAKEVIDTSNYFISDVSGHAFRNACKWTSNDGRAMTEYERNALFRRSYYDNQYYEISKMEVYNGKFYTAAQRQAVLASAFDLFIREATGETPTVGGEVAR